MGNEAEFERYLEHLCEVLGRTERSTGLKDYCRGLMLPIARKSVEPLAACADPLHVASKHQSLHHFVSTSPWSDTLLMKRVRDWVIPTLGLESGRYWIVDDTGFPKKGKDSVGVARQYCGQLGKQDNCQVAVSLSLASVQGSLPIAYRLYLPKDWAADPARRETAGVPEDITFATKPEIALAQMRQAIAVRLAFPRASFWRMLATVTKPRFATASLSWACLTRWAFVRRQRYGHRGRHRYRPNPGPGTAYGRHDCAGNPGMNRLP